jgi:nitrous oxide reductase
MTQSDDTSKVDRRAFLRGLGLSAAAAPAAALGLAAQPADAAEGKTATDASGYQETEHVRRAYDTARF